jgi:hypothetical protein
MFEIDLRNTVGGKKPTRDKPPYAPPQKVTLSSVFPQNFVDGFYFF